MSVTPTDYCGTIVFKVNGREYPVTSVDDEESNTAKPVKTMNSTLKALGSTCGASEFDLTFEAPLPLDGSEPDWMSPAMRNATIEIFPACGSGGKSELFIGVTITKKGTKYQVDNEARRTLTAHYLDKQTL